MVVDSCTSDLQQQFYDELNAPLEKAKEDMAAQEADFTESQLARIKSAEDTFIDDPFLMLTGREKNFLDKFTPVSAVHAIVGKHKEAGINQKASEHKNSDNMTTMTFCHCVNLPTLGIQGYAEESSKKMAQQKACQNFLKNLFPKGTTWLEMIEIVQNKKEILAEIVAGKLNKV